MATWGMSLARYAIALSEVDRVVTRLAQHIDTPQAKALARKVLGNISGCALVGHLGTLGACRRRKKTQTANNLPCPGRRPYKVPMGAMLPCIRRLGRRL